MSEMYYICRSRDGIHWLERGGSIARFETAMEAQQILEDELWTEFMHVYKAIRDSDGNIIYTRHWTTKKADVNEDNRQACSNCMYATKDYTSVAWGLCANSISNMFTARLSRATWCFDWAPKEADADERG